MFINITNNQFQSWIFNKAKAFTGMTHTSKPLVCLLVIIFIGMWLRIFGLAANPVSLYWDEAAMAYDAYSISQTGNDMHGNSWLQAIFPSYGDYKLPMYIWLSALSFKMFGPTITAFRLVSALAGTGLIIVLYYLSLKLFRSNAIALATSLITAISPWAIQFSRAGFEANIGLLMLSLSVLFLVEFRNKPANIVASSFFGAIGVYSYFSVRFVVPLILFGYVIVYLRELTKKHILWLGVGSFLFLILLLPIQLSPHLAASNQFRLSTENLTSSIGPVIEQNVNRELSGNSIVSRGLYHRWWFFIKRLAENMLYHFDWRYIFFNGDANLRHGIGNGGLFLTPLLFFFAGGLAIGLRRQSKTFIWLSWWWTVSLIPASIPLIVPHALRSLNALPVPILIIGYGIWALYKHRRWWMKYVFFGLAALTLVSFFVYLHNYWLHYPAHSASFWQYGYQQAAEALGQPEFAQKTVYVENIDRMYLYFLFFNRIPPELVQGKTKAFVAANFERYRFVNVNQHLIDTMNPGEVIMMAVANPLTQQFRAPVKIIADYEGQPLYGIYEKD